MTRSNNADHYANSRGYSRKQGCTRLDARRTQVSPTKASCKRLKRVHYRVRGDSSKSNATVAHKDSQLQGKITRLDRGQIDVQNRSDGKTVWVEWKGSSRQGSIRVEPVIKFSLRTKTRDHGSMQP